jgi:hypothetical protein
LLNSKRGVVVVTIWLFALLGCATTTVYQKAGSPSQDSGVVYVIRKSYPPYAFAGDLNVNGILAAKIANDSYATIGVPVGLSSIEFKFNALEGGVPLAFGLDVKPNETRYIVLTGDVSNVKDSGLVMKLRMSANAFEVNEASGRRLMQTL